MHIQAVSQEGLGSITASSATWTTWVIQNTTSATSSVMLMPAWNAWVINPMPAFPQSTPVAPREPREMHGATPSESTQAARQRARQLLLANLTLEQTKQLETQRWFDVLGSLGTRYRIFQGQIRNVTSLNEQGNFVQTYCAQPAGVPDEDAMLAQKLVLETDEAAFLRVANRVRA